MQVLYQEDQPQAPISEEKKKALTMVAKGLKWWRFRDSNPGHADYDSAALTN